ncbi:MAG TPA: sulfatase [Solirubrobacterales bacterium]|jgi:arylsulfatase A-like enzyme
MQQVRLAALAAAGVAVVVLVVVLLVGTGGGGYEPTPDPAYGSQPNFVFILADDENLEMFNRRYMRRTRKLIADPGTEFTNYFVATPLCCPSRAAMLTGQYGHNNGVLSNVPGYALLREPENILPAWLQTVGYQTGEVGKWLNGYEKTVPVHEVVPPGWDKWHGLVGAHGYTHFKASQNGEKVSFRQYVSDWIAKQSVGLIDQFSNDDQPFYLQINELAPHVEAERAQSKGRCGGEAVPAPQDARRFEGVGLPNSPSINEADVSDKPEFVAGKSRLTKEQLDLLALRYECRLEALRSLDRSIGSIMHAIEDSGEMDDTVVIFASDNGTFHGEHRLPGGKGLAYEEAAHMPLAMLVPEKYRGGNPVVPEIDEPTSNIDLVPTIVDLAGAPTCISETECRVMDGRSLVGLLSGDDSEWPAQRPLLQELNLNVEALKDIDRGISCQFRGVRDREWLYIEHTVVPTPGLGTCVEATPPVVELYDRARDPYELDNLAASPESVRTKAAARRLSEITAELADCAGIEGRDPEPASGHYCS